MNVEAEKIQFALGTLPGITLLSSINDIFAINTSVRKTIKAVSNLEFLLASKLESTLK